ncbi:hypothetical protein [Bartonella sp. CM120XJJH]|uniref:hypothetical protein n=1 Tax=Bartonella sp. CM120XJJH TaxID=3243544 RepID=UPI0035CFD007
MENGCLWAITEVVGGEEGGMDTERTESVCVPLRARNEACRASFFMMRVVGVMLTRFAV